LVPRQPSLRKDQRPEEVPFVYNENAYQTRGLRSEPMARVSVNGTMRGVQVGQMSIEPVSYDPVNNTLRVFNDIEVEVGFDGADAAATEKMLVNTYSPYFDIVYKQMFNYRQIMDVYDDHPDLMAYPVHMIVITPENYISALQPWINWKIQKGFDVNMVTTAQAGGNYNAIQSYVQYLYNTGVSQGATPTFVILVGDTGQIPGKTSGNATQKVTDLYYGSIDNDYFPDMFYSRMSAENTDQVTAIVNKILQYEQYTMPDPSYLNNVTLIAGWDSYWNPRIGQPTINYATTYYYNTAHGFTTVNAHLNQSQYPGCYNALSTGVGFVNYTAHGEETSWSDPYFSVSNVNALTNTNKYFLAMGNCCLTGNFGYSQPCFGEAMLRGENKAAYSYIGSCPVTYWYEDYYFGVGATTVMNQTPTLENTATGVYDGIWMDETYNTVSSITFLGNIAVCYAHAGNYQTSTTPLYYWQAYHVLGDGSIMPYRVNPTPNNVSHASSIPAGATSFTVSAEAGSYVGISQNNVLKGAALVPASGTVNMPVSGITLGQPVKIVVTKPQRQPYIQTIPAVALDGPFIGVDNYTPNTALIGQNTDLSITFKNLGNAATTGTTTVTLTSSDSNVSIIENTKTFGALAANATTTVNGFRFCLNEGVTLGTNVTLHYSAVNGSDTWEGNIAITPNQIFTVTVVSNNADYGTVSSGGQFNYGQSCTVTATVNPGYYFSGWTLDGELVSSEVEYTFNVTSDMNLVANFVEGVLIGDGGTATSQYLPSYNFYNYSLTQQIYTAAEIGTAGTINSIAFYNGGAEKTRTYDFYLKATTKSSFSSNADWVTVSESDKVFSGTVIMAANDWTFITFSTPFEYDGTSNLVLIADDNTGQWTSSPHMACRTFSTSGNQALYVYGDNTNYNPSNPPTSYTSQDHHNVLSQKNQILLGIDTGTPIIEQTFQLGADWNWWSPNVDITLSELKEALGNHGLRIAAQDGKFATYNANSGTWTGNLQSIELGKMYKIRTNEACTITFSSELVDPALYPITLSSGNNWIGFISTQSMSLNEAFSNFTPTDRDVIKSANGKATYYQGYGWQGSLNTLEPGKGYIYKSNATGTRTFTYPSAK